MSAAKKLIVVFGATGGQGGSVVKAILSDAKMRETWSVRGITRDVTKPSAEALRAQGAETVAADLEDKATLKKALEGAYAVFAVTNYWEKLSVEIEIAQGKAIADVAKELGVQHFVWSSLRNITELSKGTLPNVYHFDSKAKIEDYIRSIGLPATFFLPGLYMSNLPGSSIRQMPPNNAWTYAMPVPTSSPIPLLDTIDDTGKFVKAILLNREATLGKRILGATEYLTVQQVIDQFKEVFPEAGKDATAIEITHEVFKGALAGQGMPGFVQEEILENFRLLNEFGYYGGDSLEENHKLLGDKLDKLTTWKEYCLKAKPFAGLK